MPAQLVSCHGEQAVADMHGNRVRVSTIMTPEVSSGDWVLVHAGFVIQRLDPEQARATFAVIRDVDKREAG
ncbi:MAG: HypC/HybG/HupF family hydrogenase formation chaperone [Phycisphaeraceae bacterium]|nr:HypC/HybG/HupF family hydrogenase formation chaperone [Phycisphaeraceae bacterium]